MTRSGGAGCWALDNLGPVPDGDTGEDLGQLVLSINRRQVIAAAKILQRTKRRSAKRCLPRSKARMCSLVDQFILVVAPVALGKGLPLFSELAAPVPKWRLPAIKLRAATGTPSRRTRVAGRVRSGEPVWTLNGGDGREAERAVLAVCCPSALE